MATVNVSNSLVHSTGAYCLSAGCGGSHMLVHTDYVCIPTLCTSGTANFNNLTVAGNLTVQGTTTTLNTTTCTTSAMSITNAGTGPALVVNQTGSQPILDFQDDGNSSLYIEDGGYVGIGTNNPDVQVHICGSNGSLRVDRDNTGYGPSVEFNQQGNSKWILKGGQTSGCWDFAIRSSNGCERLSILQGGNVGIGSINPSYTLDVAGDVRAQSDLYIGTGGGHFYSDSGSRVRINQDFYTNNSYTYIYGDNTYLGANSANDTIHTRDNEFRTRCIKAYSSCGLQFWDDSTTEYMRLWDGGTVSTGDSAGAFQLQNNSLSKNFYDNHPGAYYHAPSMIIRKDDSNTPTLSGQATLVLYNNNGTCGTGTKLVFASRETAGAGNPVATAAIISRNVGGVSGSWACGDLAIMTKNRCTYCPAMCFDRLGRSYFQQDCTDWVGSNTYLRSSNEFSFLDGTAAQNARFKGIQVSDNYSGTVPNCGILFGADTCLLRSASGQLEMSSTANSTLLNIRSKNAGCAMVRAGLSTDGSQATGAFEVTQDGNYGGGISYNGDGSPAFASGETADHITFYRLCAGSRYEVFHYPYSSNIVNFNATPTVGGCSVWHAGNDGCGSGLDADLLDGTHASGFLLCTGMPNNTDTWLNFRVIRNANSSVSNDGMYIGYGNSNSGVTRLYGGGSQTCHSLVCSNGLLYHSSGSRYVYQADQDVMMRRGIITTNNWNDFIDGTESSYYQVNAHSGSNRPVGSYTYGTAINFSTASAGKFQLYAPHNGSEGCSLWYRTGWSTDYDAWAKIWDSANDGCGSGLDADLLDGVHGSSFLRSDANDTTSCTLTIGGQLCVDNNIYLRNYGCAVYFNRTSSSGSDYSNYIKAGCYPSQGYSAGSNYWLEYGTKGGHHFVVNTDGGAGSGENNFDDFTIWQGCVDGDRLFSVSNVGNTCVEGSLCIDSASTSGGNLKFTGAANPYICASSYIVMPGGLYVSGGTAYFSNATMHRGGICRDNGTYLQISGGTGCDTYFPGQVGIGTTDPGSCKLVVVGTTKQCGTLNMVNNNITGANHISINDPGAGEGLEWSSTSGGWMIDVSPLSRSNADGNLNFYNTGSNNIALWRPQLWVYSASCYATGTANSDGSLTITSTNTGADIFSVEGSNGTLFSVADDLSDSLMSVNDAAGLPVLEVFADSSVCAGRYSCSDFYIASGGQIGIGTTNPVTLMHLYNNIDADDAYGYFQIENGNTTSGSAATNVALTTKNYHGTSQFMQWEEHGLRLGSRITTNSGAGNLYFTTGSDSVGMCLLGSTLCLGGSVIAGSCLAVGAGNSGYLRDITGDYGSIEVDGGATNSWEGYSIGGRAVFMHNNGTATGIYNDVDNEWLFCAAHNGEATLLHNGTKRIYTTGSGACINQGSSNPGLQITGSGAEKINLSGATDPYIRFEEGTTDKAYLQWNGTQGVFKIWNQEDNRGIVINTDLCFYNGTGCCTVWHSGNDGASSGLDADLLDGCQASYFGVKDHFRSIGAFNLTGGTTTACIMAQLENCNIFDSYVGAMKSNWSYAGNCDLTDAGRLTELAGTSWLTWTDNSSDSTRGNITALVIAPNTGGSANKAFIYNDQGSSYAPGWREIWTSASDGSGSGLDADLLDGVHGSSFLRSDADDTISCTLTFAKGATGNLAARTNFPDFLGYNASYGSYIGGGAGNSSRYLYAGGYFYDGSTQQTLWHTGNDGASSGLDADLLDGNHGNHYLCRVATASTLNSTCDLNCISANQGWYKWSSSNPSNSPATYAWMLHICDNGQAHQFIQSYGGTTNKVRLFGRRKTSGNWDTSWTEYWSNKNDGSGSGLDADCLDGQQGSYYLNYNNFTNTPTIPTNYITNNADDVTTGCIDFHAGDNETIIKSGNSSATGTPDQFFITHCLGNVNIGNSRGNINISQGAFCVGSNVVWHAGNDGAGSGLDADLLDGQSCAYYRNASNLNAGTYPDLFSSTTRYNIGLIDGHSGSSRDKLRVYSSSSYTIGMQSGITFGSLNDWAMTFQMNSDDDRGFWWGDTSHTTAQGAMSLTTHGYLTVANRIRVGAGQSYTGGPSYQLQVDGCAYISSNVYVPHNIYHIGDTNTYYGFHGADCWRVVTGGTERIEIGNSATVINDGGGSHDLRVEACSTSTGPLGNKAYALFVDASAGAVGIGTSQPSYALEVNGTAFVTGTFSAGTKNFLIDHPTRENYMLRHGSLEGPENAVYVRGTTTSSSIELPEYWTGLVDEDSITATLTPRGKYLQLFLDRVEDNEIHVGGTEIGELYDYVVYGTRKDVEDLVVEFERPVGS